MNSENQLKFKELFEEHFDSNLYELVENFEDGYGELKTNVLNLELVKDERTDISDSYDFTDDILEKVFYSKDLDLYIKIEGRDVSYSGISYDKYEFVTPKTKEITIYE